MNLDSTNSNRPATIENPILQLSLRRLSHSSESLKSNPKQDDPLSSLGFQEMSLNSHNQKALHDEDFIFSEDPLKLEEIGSPFPYHRTNKSNQTRASTTEILISPFGTDSETLKLDSMTDTMIAGAKNIGYSDIFKLGISTEQRQDKHDQLLPCKAAKKLLFVQTCESGNKKHRLMHTTTVPLVQTQFKLFVEKIEALNGVEERISKFLDAEHVHMQHVGEYIREQNQGIFKGMAKLSPLTLDLSKSPLRRNRANTMCI